MISSGASDRCCLITSPQKSRQFCAKIEGPRSEILLYIFHKFVIEKNGLQQGVRPVGITDTQMIRSRRALTVPRSSFKNIPTILMSCWNPLLRVMKRDATPEMKEKFCQWLHTTFPKEKNRLIELV